MLFLQFFLLKAHNDTQELVFQTLKGNCNETQYIDLRKQKNLFVLAVYVIWITESGMQQILPL